MAMTPAYALAHVFLPNLLRLKGTSTIVGVIERKEKFFFDAVWQQAHVEHAPHLHFQVRDPYQIGVIDLPKPTEMGEVHMVAFVGKKADQSFGRVFMLEHDYVLATKSDRTLICERVGKDRTKHTEGPPVTGDPEVDAAAFVDALMELLVPTKVKPR